MSAESEILTAARLERRAVPQLSDSFPDLDLARAYEIQREQREGRGDVIGWKLGVTSRAKQVQVGVDSPIRGFLATDHVLDYGEPLVVAEHINPRCEPEIAFVMGADLAGAHVTTTEVLAATAGVAAGIEVLDSRYTDYRFTMPDVVADNSSAGRYVIGSPVPVIGIDLRLVGVVMEQNGEVVATASGAASLGHPASAVAWLVRSLAADGEGLRKGDVIISGGLTAATPVVAGDTIVVSIDRIGSVELACR
ncbi:MAG: 4-oxalocrotonate decarboxylase [Nocardioidaceae bacterium]|nr:4-oxalocrotonate decarboxylase [Nocardioidaceae bacterium]